MEIHGDARSKVYYDWRLRHKYSWFQRYSGDMDICIDDSPANRANLRKALKSAGKGEFEMIGTMHFIPGWTDFILNNGLKLDIVTEMKGLEEFSFDDSYHMATIAEIENTGIPFLHIKQLIANKKVVNRPKDQLDVI